MYDTLTNVTWLVGSIDEITKELRISIVSNRSSVEMTKFFKRIYLWYRQTQL